MYHGNLSKLARERLGVMRDSNDGFEIARKDLQLRGPGEVLGTRQTGQLQMRVADLERDQHFMPDVLVLADTMLKKNPQNCVELINRWLGQNIRYGHV